jgi:hypothetical protein
MVLGNGANYKTSPDGNVPTVPHLELCRTYHSTHHRDLIAKIWLGETMFYLCESTEYMISDLLFFTVVFFSLELLLNLDTRACHGTTPQPDCLPLQPD